MWQENIMNKIYAGAIMLCSLIGFIFVVRHVDHERACQGSLNDQLVTFLQEYIRIETTHPKPDYDAAIRFLKKHAQADGFLYQEVTVPSGKKVVVITYKGSDPALPAIALNHHMDVVPATQEGWIRAPFSGDIVDGVMIGRGTQDMKGIGALHYFALKELKQQGIIPSRTIHLFAVPDEEVGGFKGTKEFVETQQFKDLNVGFIVDEGHASGIDGILDIKVSERKPIQVRITSTGACAHGSHLQCHNAVHDLVAFLGQICEIHGEQQSRVGAQQPGQLLSCNITSLTAGVKKEDGHIALNMVPDSAQATIDIRVPPTLKREQVIHMLETYIQKYPNMKYDILAQATEEPEMRDYHTPLYNALEAAIDTCNLKAQPHYFEASSDLRFYQARGLDGVGFTPFTVTDNIHGINESVPIAQLIQGKDIVVQLLKDFCVIGS
jgi:N-acyl-L-amino-acid amidohydrolase